MAMEAHVFFHGKLPTKAAFGQVLNKLGFPLSIESTTGSLEEHSGFIPMIVRNEESGVEFDVFNDRDVVLELAGVDLDPRFDRMASFRWGGDESEMLAGLCASAALAKLTDGLVLDEAHGKLRSAGAAIRNARKTLKRSVAPATRPHGGTRPADIKRYVKPLLEQRSDLVLIGRLLLIRPIRHLLRGVSFERTSDKYSFRIRPLLKLLADGPAGVGYADPIHEGHWGVWQTHFHPLLIDSLAEDIFSRLGRLTTLADLAAELAHTDQFADERVTALVLAGERDRAAGYVRDLERQDLSYWRHRAAAKWRFLDRSIDDVCAEFHAKEAGAAQDLKLGDAWQPAPFAVEVPTAERPGGSSDPLFLPTPWIVRPSWLTGDAPELPGDVCFAKDWLERNGRVVLEVPLTAEQAEDRHQHARDYALVARLPDALLVLSRFTSWDPDEPSRFGRVRPPGRMPPALWPISLHLRLRAPSLHLLAEFSGDLGGEFIRLGGIEVYQPRPRRSVWQWGVYDDHNSIHDHRGNELLHTKTAVTEADHALLRCPMPPFGKFDEPVTRVRAMLRGLGYGELG